MSDTDSRDSVTPATRLTQFSHGAG